MPFLVQFQHPLHQRHTTVTRRGGGVRISFRRGTEDANVSDMKAVDSEHDCHATFGDTAEAAFPVRWLRGDSLDRFGRAPKAAKRVWLAVCGFSHRIFRLAYYGPLDLILVSDLVIASGKCEEARRCLARQCPLNRTPDSTVRKLFRPRKGERLNLADLTGNRYCALFEEKLNEGGIILPPGYRILYK